MSSLNLKPKRDVPGLGWATLTEAVALASVMGLLVGSMAGAVMDFGRYFIGGTNLPVAGFCAIVFCFIGAIAGLGLWLGSEK